MLDNVRLQPDLQPGEMLEWTGRPHPWHVFTSSDVYLIPFSLFWFGFVVFWETGVLSADAPLFFSVWGVPFLLVGLYFTVGRFLYSAWERRHIWYGVTNQRIIILTTTFGHRVTSYYFFNMLPGIETRISASGRGTLLFGPPPSYGSFSWSFGGWRRNVWHRDLTSGFYDIPDARYVFDLISWHLRGSR